MAPDKLKRLVTVKKAASRVRPVRGSIPEACLAAVTVIQRRRLGAIMASQRFRSIDLALPFALLPKVRGRPVLQR
jgi:hypothetical protein